MVIELISTVIFSSVKSVKIKATCAAVDVDPLTVVGFMRTICSQMVRYDLDLISLKL